MLPLSCTRGPDPTPPLSSGPQEDVAGGLRYFSLLRPCYHRIIKNYHLTGLKLVPSSRESATECSSSLSLGFQPQLQFVQTPGLKACYSLHCATFVLTGLSQYSIQYSGNASTHTRPLLSRSYALSLQLLFKSTFQTTMEQRHTAIKGVPARLSWLRKG